MELIRLFRGVHLNSGPDHAVRWRESDQFYQSRPLNCKGVPSNESDQVAATYKTVLRFAENDTNYAVHSPCYSKCYRFNLFNLFHLLDSNVVPLFISQASVVYNG